MYKVQFGNYNSYDDWELTLISMTIGVPAQKTNYVNIPAMNGQIDLSGALSNYPVYDMRTISYTFAFKCDVDTFEQAVSYITNRLHGKDMHVINNDNPFYFDGRVTVASSTFTGLDKGQITINLYCKPYMYAVEETVRTFALSSTETEIQLFGSMMPVIPTFTATESANVTFGNVTVSMDAGTHRFSNIVLTNGANTMRISGTGTLTVAYRGGRL